MSSKTKKRIDFLVHELNFANSRSHAQALIMAGKGFVNDQKVTKPGTLFNPAISTIRVNQSKKFVSRGGEKLQHALDTFNIHISETIALDIGASTGGFTDCLLQNGSSKVYALDVGKNQLDYKLRINPKVVTMEGINARNPFGLDEKVDLITMDVSFISARLLLKNISTYLKSNGSIIWLLKPQFEAKKEEVGRRGLIKDYKTHSLIIGRLTNWLINNQFSIKNFTTSPIRGQTGNKEFFVHLKLSEYFLHDL